MGGWWVSEGCEEVSEGCVPLTCRTIQSMMGCRVECRSKFKLISPSDS